MKDHWVEVDKRFLVIAPEVDCRTKIVNAKATTDTQSSAIGQQTTGRVGFFLHSDDFTADYNAMRAAGVFFEQAPGTNPRVGLWLSKTRSLTVGIFFIGPMRNRP